MIFKLTYTGNVLGVNNGNQSSKVEQILAKEKNNKASIAKIMKWVLSLLGGASAIIAIIEWYSKK